MSAGEWLAATGAVLLAVLLGGLLFALVALVVTVRSLRGTVERLQEETLAITARMQDAITDAEHEVDRVDALGAAILAQETKRMPRQTITLVDPPS